MLSVVASIDYLSDRILDLVMGEGLLSVSDYVVMREQARARGGK